MRLLLPLGQRTGQYKTFQTCLFTISDTNTNMYTQIFHNSCNIYKYRYKHRKKYGNKYNTNTSTLQMYQTWLFRMLTLFLIVKHPPYIDAKYKDLYEFKCWKYNQYKTKIRYVQALLLNEDGLLWLLMASITSIHSPSPIQLPVHQYKCRYSYNTMQYRYRYRCECIYRYNTK